MNKKGFTLAELLAVLVVLGIIAAITIPIVTDQVDEHRKKLCITQYESILTAARAYGADNVMTLKDSDTVTLATLQQKGYIDENIKNPMTKDEISGDLTITINVVGTTNNVKFKYSLEHEPSYYCK